MNKRPEKTSEVIERLLAETPPGEKIYVSKTMHIAALIINILKAKGISQREFSEMINVEESLVSRWLSGTHNFTIKTISNIESTLGESILILAFPQKEMFYQRSIQNPYPTVSLSNTAYEKGFTECYNHFIQPQH